jgi:hypothetical protein
MPGEEREQYLVSIHVGRCVTAFEPKEVCATSYPGRGEPQEEDQKPMREPVAIESKPTRSSRLALLPRAARQFPCWGILSRGSNRCWNLGPEASDPSRRTRGARRLTSRFGSNTPSISIGSKYKCKLRVNKLSTRKCNERRRSYSNNRFVLKECLRKRCADLNHKLIAPGPARKTRAVRSSIEWLSVSQGNPTCVAKGCQ